MPFSSLIGNTPAKNALTRMVEQKAVPHALLFSGPAGVGKSRFALAFASLLMGPSHEAKLHTGQHPDLHVYHPEGKAHLHSMESIRSLIDEVAMPPFEAPVKVFILHDAHLMLPSSSNALLKTLEEPQLDSYLILLTSEEESLLPTIYSRCRKIPFFPLAQEWSSLSQDQDQYKILHQLFDEIGSPHFQKLCMQLESACGLGKTEADEEGESALRQMDALFQEIALHYRDRYLLSQGIDTKWLSSPSALPAFAPSLEHLLQALAHARLAMQRHVKLRVVLEELFFQLTDFPQKLSVVTEELN